MTQKMIEMPDSYYISYIVEKEKGIMTHFIKAKEKEGNFECIEFLTDQVSERLAKSSRRRGYGKNHRKTADRKIRFVSF